MSQLGSKLSCPLFDLPWRRCVCCVRLPLPGTEISLFADMDVARSLVFMPSCSLVASSCAGLLAAIHLDGDERSRPGEPQPQHYTQPRRPKPPSRTTTHSLLSSSLAPGSACSAWRRGWAPHVSAHGAPGKLGYPWSSAACAVALAAAACWEYSFGDRGRADTHCMGRLGGEAVSDSQSRPSRWFTV